MYSGRWTPGLRQGDILGPCPYPKLKNLPQQARREGWKSGSQPAQALEFPADDRYAVVVSHDCEFNATKRVHFLLARVEAFSPRLDEPVRAEIKASNDAIRIGEGNEGAERWDYIDTFVLDPLPPHFETDMLVRFTAITAWPMSDLKTFVDLKRAELEHAHRVRLRKKLGFFFGRDADDEPDEKKFDAPASTD